MILVGVTNMATALLVLILERSRMVGLLKAVGARNKLIQKIFLYNGAVIMFKGLVVWESDWSRVLFFSKFLWMDSIRSLLLIL